MLTELAGQQSTKLLNLEAKRTISSWKLSSHKEAGSGEKENIQLRKSTKCQMSSR